MDPGRNSLRFENGRPILLVFWEVLGNISQKDFLKVVALREISMCNVDCSIIGILYIIPGLAVNSVTSSSEQAQKE